MANGSKSPAQVKQEEIQEFNGSMIYPLIGKAMAKIRAIGKDSDAKNYSGKVMYKFRGIDDVYNALNPVMGELGLFIIPEVLEQKREERTSSTGGALIYSILTVRFTMYAPDGSYVQGTTIGEGMDSGDKATNKAMSIAMKYFCFQVFMIPTEEMKDPDAEVHEVAPRNAQKPVQKAAPAPAAPAAAPVARQAQKPAQQPAVQMTTAAKAPEVANPVIEYLKNEMEFMRVRFQCNEAQMKAKFSEMRKALIAGGVVPNIKFEDMTKEQAEQLVESIIANFMTDGEKPA